MLAAFAYSSIGFVDGAAVVVTHLDAVRRIRREHTAAAVTR
jgi:hypothetical protein